MNNTNVYKTDFDGERKFFRKLSTETAVNLQFSDLMYGVKNGKQKASKYILNGVSGEFRAGELSAIIGPSGAGKTTLLNLLAGYRIHTNSGHINVNDKPRDMKTFRKISRYVLQDDDISGRFTIMETMMFASNFKLESDYTMEQREAEIFQILDIFHLRKQANTLISKISGGERKRVCIALEIIDNPSVLLLDEPITGLDEVSASQCIRLLKQLAESGHTIICSLHCPSARLFHMFDKIYAVAEGQCIYQGAVEHIVPYLKEFDLHCPVTHNPTDFIIDVATKAYGDFHHQMVHEIRNGRILKWLPPYCEKARQTDSNIMLNEKLNFKSKIIDDKSWWMEYRLLFIRFMEEMWRDMTNFKLRVIVHILCSLVVGFTYLNVSSSAKWSPYTYYFALIVLIGFFFLAMAPVLASVPRDIKFMRREYFNQWYRLSSYFMALTTSQLPMIASMSIICSPLLYFMTDQPMQLFRLALFVVMIFTVALMSACFGVLLGCSFSGLHALFLGPLYVALMTIFAHQSVDATKLSTFQEIVIYSSVVRYPLEGVLDTLLGFARPEYPCPPEEYFCFHSKPKSILRSFGCLNISSNRSLLIMYGLSLVFSLLAFMILRYRLNYTKKSRSSSKKSVLKPL